MKRLFFIVFFATVLPGIALAETETSPAAFSEAKLVIGVRDKVRPFAYSSTAVFEENLAAKSGPLRARGHKGYMVYICDEVLKAMSVSQTRNSPPFDIESQVQVRVLDQAQDGISRFDALNSGGEGIDILCDPATITRDRVKSFAVSLPLFATGISVLSLIDKVPPPPEAVGYNFNEPLIGVVGKTTAMNVGIELILKSGEWGRYREKITKALRAIDDGTEQDEDPVKGVIRAYADHDDAAKAFCNGEVTYYVGDLEIISANADRYPGCEWQRAPRSYTSDRYGIFANMDYRTEQSRNKAVLIGRFFEVLNREIATRDSLLDRAYLATFGTRPKSQALEMFFWSVRGVR